MMFHLRFTLTIVFASACSDSPAAQRDAGPGSPDAGRCEESSVRCVGNRLERCSLGVFTPVETCSSRCFAPLGCVDCVPGSRWCDGNDSHACGADGTEDWDALEECDPIRGLSCNVGSGHCNGSCALDALGYSNAGCEFFPVVLATGVRYDLAFGIAIANTTDREAIVRIEGPDFGPQDRVVAPAGTLRVELPWIDSLKACPNFEGENAPCETGDRFHDVLERPGAYRVRSTEPVVVYQFSPLDFVTPSGYPGFTADASLLLPTHVWGRDHVAATYTTRWLAAESSYPTEVSVTASTNGTHVRVVPTVDTTFMVAREPMMFELDRGDVLQFFSPLDLTGTTIESDAPIQVLSGHFQTIAPAPEDTESLFLAADHLEEVTPPTEALGRSYVICPAANLYGGDIHFARVVALEDDVDLTFEPPLTVSGTPHLEDRGDVFLVPLDDVPHAITATKKILVLHFMVSAFAVLTANPDAMFEWAGDPAMSIAIPVEQYRNDYDFYAPPSYAVNYVTVAAHEGANVELDGRAIDPSEWAPVGTSEWRVVSRRVYGSSGFHRVRSNVPVGITVYGYGLFTSYMYPGGLELEPILE